MELGSDYLAESGGGSGSGSGLSSAEPSLNGLKFGKKIYFEDVGTAGAPFPGSGSSSGSGSGSGRKVRGGGGGMVTSGQQPPRCQVEGCKVDLSDAKAYYSRHKVCGMHSKSPVVTVAGLEQRFCQQCSRSAHAFAFFFSFFLLFLISDLKLANLVGLIFWYFLINSWWVVCYISELVD